MMLLELTDDEARIVRRALREHAEHAGRPGYPAYEVPVAIAERIVL